MRKLLPILLIAMLVLASCSPEAKDKEIGLGLPEELQGEWYVFKGYKTSIRILINRDSIQGMDLDKGGIVYDIVSTRDGAILSQFDPETYSPVDKLVGYSAAYPIGYQLKWQDKVIWLMCTPESNAMRFIQLEGIENNIRYKYSLIRI